MTPLLRIAAIDFLNPAPLMWNFEHAPQAAELARRYEIEKMAPAACAQALGRGSADIGLIPIGAYGAIPEPTSGLIPGLTPGLLVIPGCAIASLGSIRSLLLVIRAAEDSPEPVNDGNEEPDLEEPTPGELARIGTVALDTASRTSALYTQVLFRQFWRHTPRFLAHAPELDGMLQAADAALLIGDPALLALRDRAARQGSSGERLRYLDLGHLWHRATGTAWVSAFWAIRESSLRGLSAGERAGIARDFLRSRDAGLAHVEELVSVWAPRLKLRAETVRTYLTRNIHYALDGPAIAGVERFFAETYALGLVPSRAELAFLE